MFYSERKEEKEKEINIHRLEPNFGTKNKFISSNCTKDEVFMAVLDYLRKFSILKTRCYSTEWYKEAT